MIKNNLQARRVETRLNELKSEISQMEARYSGEELDFWAGYLKNEMVSLESELNEYQLLQQLPFKEAIEGPLREPVLLENIGELLGKLRIAAKLTQDEMAEKLGWQQPNLSRFEGENYSSQTIAKITEFIGALGVYLHVMPSLAENSPNIIYKPVKMLEHPSAEITDDFSTTGTAIQGEGKRDRGETIFIDTSPGSFSHSKSEFAST